MSEKTENIVVNCAMVFIVICSVIFAISLVNSRSVILEEKQEFGQWCEDNGGRYISGATIYSKDCIFPSKVESNE